MIAEDFDLNYIVFEPTTQTGPIIAVVGERETGKTTIINNILSRFRDVSTVHRVTSFDEDNLARIVKDQTEKYDREDADPRCILVFDDDCIGLHEGILSSNTLREILVNGRHLHIMTIIAMQYAKGISPIMRANIDFVFKTRGAVTGSLDEMIKFIDCYQCTDRSSQELLDLEVGGNEFSAIVFSRKNQPRVYTLPDNQELPSKKLKLN